MNFAMGQMIIAKQKGNSHKPGVNLSITRDFGNNKSHYTGFTSIISTSEVFCVTL